MMDVVWTSIETSVRVTWLLVRMPLVIAKCLYRLIWRLAGALTLLRTDVLPCRGCGNPVSLVGRWQCGRCKFTTDGFMFARCPVCGSVPPYIPCADCGVGLRNPVSK